MGLRMSEGIDLARFTALSGTTVSGPRVEVLRELGMISLEKQRLTVLPKGRMVLNSVLSELLVD